MARLICEQELAMQLCEFPKCTDGDTSYDAFRACDRCLVIPRQYDRHVQEYYFRLRTGRMVLQSGRMFALAAQT